MISDEQLSTMPMVATPGRISRGDGDAPGGAVGLALGVCESDSADDLAKKLG